MKTGLMIAAGALGVAALWQGNETLDKVGTVVKWGAVAGGLYFGAKALKLVK